MTLFRTANGVEELKCPLWLYQLLARMPFSGRGPKLGPEDRVAIEFADRCRAHAMNGRLIGTFSHLPHEVGGGMGAKSALRYTVAAALGFVAGSGDYVFVRPGCGIWMECKAPAKTKAIDGVSRSGGRQNPAQVLFGKWCGAQAVPYHLFSSADEGEEILRRHGFLA